MRVTCELGAFSDTERYFQTPWVLRVQRKAVWKCPAIGHGIITVAAVSHGTQVLLEFLECGRGVFRGHRGTGKEMCPINTFSDQPEEMESEACFYTVHEHDLLPKYVDKHLNM